jgi:cytochrome P450
MDEVIEGVRSKKILHHPDMFAGVPDDPVNGEINVNEFLRGSLVFTHGQEHRDRRRLLNHLLRPDALNTIREEIIIPAARELIARRLRIPDGRMARLRGCAGPLAAGASSQFLENRTEINRIALEAKRTYVEEFYRPSFEYYRGLIEQVNAGTLAPETVPSNIMSLIAQGADPAYRDEDRAIVETTMMFAASVGTSTQSIIQTVHFLLDWFTEHPEDRPTGACPGTASASAPGCTSASGCVWCSGTRGSAARTSGYWRCCSSSVWTPTRSTSRRA